MSALWSCYEIQTCNSRLASIAFQPKFLKNDTSNVLSIPIDNELNDNILEQSLGHFRKALVTNKNTCTHWGQVASALTTDTV